MVSRTTRAGGPARLHSQNLLLYKLFVFFPAAGESEGIRHVGFAVDHAGDDVGAADPVGFGEVRLRPARRMVGMRVVEADDVEPGKASLLLRRDQLPGIDAVAVVR